MVLSITSAYNANSQAPGLTLSLGGLTGFQKYSVTRTDVSGSAAPYALAPVRGADYIDVVGNLATITDYEVPLGCTVEYTLNGWVGGVITSSVVSATNSVTVANVGANNFFWIKNVPNPTTSKRVMIGDFSAVEFQPTVLGEYKILGRQNPVVFTDVWGAKSGGMEIVCIEIGGTYTTDPQSLESLLTSGDVLLFQSIINTHQIRDMYFVVNGLGREQYNAPKLNFNNDYTFKVSFQETDQPSTFGLATGYGIWQDLKDDPTYTTWGQVLSGNATWLSVLNRYSV